MGVGQRAVDVNENDGGIEEGVCVRWGCGCPQSRNYPHNKLYCLPPCLLQVVLFTSLFTSGHIVYLLVYFRCTKGSSAVARDSGTTHTYVLHVELHHTQR